MSRYTNDNSDDSKMWDIFTHKEEYRKEKLEEVKKYFMDNGYYAESKELKMYIESIEQDENEDDNQCLHMRHN